MNYKKIYNDFVKDRKAKEPEYLKGLRYFSVRTKLRRKFGQITPSLGIKINFL